MKVRLLKMLGNCVWRVWWGIARARDAHGLGVVPSSSPPQLGDLSSHLPLKLSFPICKLGLLALCLQGWHEIPRDTNRAQAPAGQSCWSSHSLRTLTLGPH